MKFVIVLILTVAAQSYAADESPAAFPMREHRVRSGFIGWLEEADNSPPAKPSAKSEETVRAEVCEGLTFGTGHRPWPSGTHAIYLPASSIVIIRHTAPFHDAFHRLYLQWQRQGSKAPPAQNGT